MTRSQGRRRAVPMSVVGEHGFYPNGNPIESGDLMPIDHDDL